ncbi:MAG: GHKL domain-containing protein [Angelakisella sp.]
MIITDARQILTFLLLSTAETFILHRLLIAFLLRNSVQTRYYRQGLAAYFIFQLFSYELGAPLFSTAALYFLFTMAIATVFFSDSLQIKATVSSLFVVLNYACKVLAVTLLMSVGHQTMPDLPQELVLGWSAQIAACLLFWSCVFIIIGFRGLRIRNHQVAYTLITYTVPMGILYIVMRMFYHSHSRTASFIYLDASGLLFCTALALFYLLDKSVVIDQTSEKNVMTLQLLTTQEKYYRHLEDFQKEMQSIRHDIKNHMQCVITMMEQGEYTDAERYLRQIYDSAVKTESPIHCGNKVIDIVLNHSISNMRRMGVTYEVNVLVPPSLPPIDSLDLCTIFGNLLDNAVEACSRMDAAQTERKITINAKVHKGYLFVNISNTFNGEIRMQNDIYQTVKTGVRFSGIGLSNVRRVVEKYSGEMSIHHEGNLFTVAAMLALED